MSGILSHNPRIRSHCAGDNLHVLMRWSTVWSIPQDQDRPLNPLTRSRHHCATTTPAYHYKQIRICNLCNYNYNYNVIWDYKCICVVPMTKYKYLSSQFIRLRVPTMRINTPRIHQTCTNGSGNGSVLHPLLLHLQYNGRILHISISIRVPISCMQKSVTPTRRVIQKAWQHSRTRLCEILTGSNTISLTMSMQSNVMLFCLYTLLRTPVNIYYTARIHRWSGTRAHNPSRLCYRYYNVIHHMQVLQRPDLIYMPMSVSVYLDIYYILMQCVIWYMKRKKPTT